MRKVGLDVVLVIDATDSMAPYIEQIKLRLGQVMDVVTRLVPEANFGVVVYKDYGDGYGPNAVRFLPLTSKVQTVTEFIQGINPGGGGDEPEPIHEALAVSTNFKQMGWRMGTRKGIILVGDSPTHSAGQKMALKLAGQFARAGGTINVLDTGGTAVGTQRQMIRPELAQIATAGKGSSFLLTEQDEFWRRLIVSVFGEQNRQDINTVIDRVMEQRPLPVQLRVPVKTTD
jgi:Mg-chelatase subunit ChlD